MNTNNYALNAYRLFFITCLSIGIGTLYLIANKRNLESLGLDLFSKIESDWGDEYE